MLEPFTYCIPLRPKRTAANWSRVEQLLAAALATALEGRQIKVVVAGTDEPDVEQFRDERVAFVKVDALADQMADKQNKKQFALHAAATAGAGLYMYLDADDHVHRDLPHVARRLPGDGMVMAKGYELHVGMGRYWQLSNFDQYCGTCAVFRFKPEDLPKYLGDADCYASRFRDHSKWKALAQASGRPLVPTSFLGALYTISNGENHSSRMGHPSRKRRIYRTLVPGKKIDVGLRTAFAGLALLE